MSNMESSFLNSPALKPVGATAEEPAALPSIKGIASAKVWARRRRHSLFDPHRSTSDIGNSFLSHADFPKPRARSLTSLRGEKKIEFDKISAYKVMEQVVNMELSFRSYNSKECSASAEKIAQLIKDKISSTFDLTLFKVVCLCHITKRAKPSLAIDSGCAWDEMTSREDKDIFVDYVYKNQHIVAVASVFALNCQRRLKDMVSADGLAIGSKIRSATISEPASRRRPDNDFVVTVTSPRKE